MRLEHRGLTHLPLVLAMVPVVLRRLSPEEVWSPPPPSIGDCGLHSFARMRSLFPSTSATRPTNAMTVNTPTTVPPMILELLGAPGGGEVLALTAGGAGQ